MADTELPVEEASVLLSGLPFGLFEGIDGYFGYLNPLRWIRGGYSTDNRRWLSLRRLREGRRFGGPGWGNFRNRDPRAIRSSPGLHPGAITRSATSSVPVLGT
jgi:hypothetical protein